MKNSPARGQTLPPMDVDDGIEVVELFGDFGEAQFKYAEQKVLEAAWADTEKDHG